MIVRFVTHTKDHFGNVSDTPPSTSEFEVIVWEATNTQIDGNELKITYMIMHIEHYNSYKENPK